jgi:hypothetical protein
MAGQEQHYLSYVLRMWLPVGETHWHASLLDPETGKRVGFASLQGVWAYLEERAGRLASQAGQAASEPAKGGETRASSG